MTRKFTLLPVLLLAVSICAFGQLIDPATLHIGTGAGTLCAVGCGGDPNLVSGTNFDVYQNDGGQGATLTTPLLVILGIPDYSGVAPTMTGVTAYSPYVGVATGGTAVASFGIATQDYFGGTYALTAGASAMGTLTAGEEAYTDLGLADANLSNSFTNWSTTGATATGITTPTSYGLYVYEINFSLVNKGLFDITWGGSGLPNGTMAIAYGCQGEAAGSLVACTANPNPFNTPFTESGGVTTSTTSATSTTDTTNTTNASSPVPEPNSIMLLGTALLGACALLRKKLVRS